MTLRRGSLPCLVLFAFASANAACARRAERSDERAAAPSTTATQPTATERAPVAPSLRGDGGRVDRGLRVLALRDGDAGATHLTSGREPDVALGVGARIGPGDRLTLKRGGAVLKTIPEGVEFEIAGEAALRGGADETLTLYHGTLTVLAARAPLEVATTTAFIFATQGTRIEAGDTCRVVAGEGARIASGEPFREQRAVGAVKAAASAGESPTERCRRLAEDARAWWQRATVDAGAMVAHAERRRSARIACAVARVDLERRGAKGAAFADLASAEALYRDLPLGQPAADPTGQRAGQGGATSDAGNVAREPERNALPAPPPSGSR